MKFFNPLKAMRSPKLREVFYTQYLPQRIPDASPATVRGYKITFNLFDRFLRREARLRDLNNNTVARFQYVRLKEVARATCYRDIASLKAIWTWACKKNLLKEWHDLKPIGLVTPTPIALTQEQVNRVWQAIQAETRPVVVSCSPLLEVPAPVWWSAIYLLSWDTAERFTPIFELHESSLDLENRWVTFPAADRKGRTADNVKRIHADTAAAIEKLLSCYRRRTYCTRVFRWAIGKSLIWRRLADIMTRAGLPDTKEFKFHCIRKSVASHLTAAGGNAQRMLCHTSGATTEKHYHDPRIVHDDSGQLAKLFRPGGNGETPE